MQHQNYFILKGFFLHHNFVVALLNDLFGIQCRGGCMCAGPYAQVLLGIDDKLASVYEAQLKTSESKDGNLLKPGFVRISFNFHSSDEEVNFIIDAVKLVARFGWRLLPHYRIDSETASFISTVNHVEDVVVQTQVHIFTHYFFLILSIISKSLCGFGQFFPEK